MTSKPHADGALEALLRARKSVRGFRNEEVPRDELRSVFAVAQQAPSWCNIQPWRVWVTSGSATRALTAAIEGAAKSGLPQPDVAFPGTYPAPYDAHRRACGAALYTAMGVARHDAAARQDAWMRNFRAFDAPHIAIVAVDHRLGAYPLLDIGCWLQTLLLAATERGIGTCAQASLATYPAVLRAFLGIPDELHVLLGVSLGYEDGSVNANACRTTRSEVDENVVFVDGPMAKTTSPT